MGMGGECVRLVCDVSGRQPAALNEAELRKLSSTVMSRSPTPSAISSRYLVRSWYETSLLRHQQASPPTPGRCWERWCTYSSNWRMDMMAARKDEQPPRISV